MFAAPNHLWQFNETYFRADDGCDTLGVVVKLCHREGADSFFDWQIRGTKRISISAPHIIHQSSSPLSRFKAHFTQISQSNKSVQKINKSMLYAATQKPFLSSGLLNSTANICQWAYARRHRTGKAPPAVWCCEAFAVRRCDASVRLWLWKFNNIFHYLPLHSL